VYLAYMYMYIFGAALQPCVHNVLMLYTVNAVRSALMYYLVDSAILSYVYSFGQDTLERK